MSQLLYRNWNSKILTQKNKILLVTSVKNLSTKPFSFFSSFPLLNFLRQTLLNNQKLFNYARHTLTNLIRNRLKNAKIQFNELKQSKRLYALSFSTAGLFSWDDSRITNNEVKCEINDILNTFKLSEQNHKIDFEESRHHRDSEWEKIYDKKDLIIWRRQIMIEDNEMESDSEKANLNELYEYKVLGRINDVTPIEFYETQIDINFRKKWDFLVISIEMLDKDVTSNTELIRWVSKFPYPLYPREYIFVRRYCIEPQEKLLILISRALEEFDLNSFQRANKAIQCVRVTKYKSNMIIIPHNDFDKPGLDYVMQYYDVNKAKIPSMAYKWMASSGLPDYMEKLHKATLQLKNINQKMHKSNRTKAELLSKFEMFHLRETSTKIHEESTAKTETIENNDLSQANANTNSSSNANLGENNNIDIQNTSEENSSK